ncbi:hypothetical protein AAFC00_007342 [Neodothiora populina]
MTYSRWCDIHWKALFEESTLVEDVAYECAQRLPWNLINGRAKKRHQKTVHKETGEVVAYARWILPQHLSDADKANVIWEDAQVVDVNIEQQHIFKKNFDSVTDDGQIRHLKKDLLNYRSTPLEEVDAKFTKSGPYLGEAHRCSIK